MDANDSLMFDTWQREIAIAEELLADIAVGRTTRTFHPAEIAEIQARRDRTVALVAFYKAQLDA